MTGQPLRPMGIGDIFDEGFDLYKKNLSFFILVSALIIVPGLIIQQILSNTLMGGSRVSPPLPTDISQYFDWAATYFSANSPIITSGTIAYVLSFAALIAATSARYINQPMSIGGVFMLLLRRSVKLLITLVLVTLIVTTGFALCLIPGFFPAVLFVFASHAVMVENPRLLGGIGRSVALVNGQGWRTFWFLLMLYILYAILNFALVTVVTYVIALVINAIPGSGDAFGGLTGLGGVSIKDEGIRSVGASIASLLVTPFIVAVMTVYYYDLRVRNEAYDVLALARELNYKPLSELGPYLPSALPPGAMIYSQPARVNVKKTKGKP